MPVIGRRFSGRPGLEPFVRPQVIGGLFEDALLDEVVHALGIRRIVAAGEMRPGGEESDFKPSCPEIEMDDAGNDRCFGQFAHPGQGWDGGGLDLEKIHKKRIFGAKVLIRQVIEQPTRFECPQYATQTVLAGKDQTFSPTQSAFTDQGVEGGMLDFRVDGDDVEIQGQKGADGVYPEEMGREQDDRPLRLSIAHLFQALKVNHGAQAPFRSEPGDPEGQGAGHESLKMTESHFAALGLAPLGKAQRQVDEGDAAPFAGEDEGQGAEQAAG